MTLRHDIKVRQGDSWSSPKWAIVMPGGTGVDLSDGWEVTASVRLSRTATDPLHTYTVGNGGVIITTGTIPLSTGEEIDTSVVVLRHTNDADLPIFVGPWDCQITKGSTTYTIAEGTFRTVKDVTHE